MNDNRKIKFAIVGSGHIGKRHAEMISRNPEAELIAMCDIKPKSELGLEKNVAAFFSSIEELLNSDIDFDVLSVCSPNGLHADHTLKALEFKKHVVIEKPMALKVADCEKIIFKALQVSRQVFCVMQNRYSPPSMWIKDVVKKNLFGRIFLVQLNCYWNRDQRYYNGKNWKGTADLDGGTLFTQFSHFIDIMYWLFGDIIDIKARFADFNHKDNTAFEDSGIVSFDFLNGGMGCINYSTAVWDNNLESSITIIGENGSVTRLARRLFADEARFLRHGPEQIRAAEKRLKPRVIALQIIVDARVIVTLRAANIASEKKPCRVLRQRIRIGLTFEHPARDVPRLFIPAVCGEKLTHQRIPRLVRADGFLQPLAPRQRFRVLFRAPLHQHHVETHRHPFRVLRIGDQRLHQLRALV